MACAAILGFLTLAGLVTPWLLLGMTFALGLGSALAAPTWAAIIPDVVDRPQVPDGHQHEQRRLQRGARQRSGTGRLCRRGGAGPRTPFSSTRLRSWPRSASCFAGDPASHASAAASGEAVYRMVLAGLKYVWQVEAQRVVLVRSMLWMLCASAFWGLLPVVARRELESGGDRLRIAGDVRGRGRRRRRIRAAMAAATGCHQPTADAGDRDLHRHVPGAGLGALFAADLCRAGHRRRGLDDVQPEFSDRGADERTAAHGRSRDRSVLVDIPGWARRLAPRCGAPSPTGWATRSR